MSRLTTRLYALFFGRQVGADRFGNRYYQNRHHRWVVYKKSAEASAVTPEWHGWLHKITDVTPLQSPPPHRVWERAPRPNLTGTAAAYVPAGSLLKSAHHAPTTADYEPWTP